MQVRVKVFNQQILIPNAPRELEPFFEVLAAHVKAVFNIDVENPSRSFKRRAGSSWRRVKQDTLKGDSIELELYHTLAADVSTTAPTTTPGTCVAGPVTKHTQAPPTPKHQSKAPGAKQAPGTPKKEQRKKHTHHTSKKDLKHKAKE